MRRLGILISFIPILLSLIGWSAAAQTDAGTCTPLIEQALIQLDRACGQLERNTACYGNTRVEAEFTRAELSALFSRPGDRTGINELVALRTSPLDVQRDEWGIAALAVQANLPDALPGQNVIFVLIGDAEISADPDVNPAAGPMQAVRIRTDFRRGRTCDNAPRSLVLAQGPRDVRVEITVNGLNIDMGSTIALYQNADDRLWVTTLEGDVELDGFYPLPAGSSAQVQLNPDGRAERVLEVRPLSGDEIDELAPIVNLPAAVLQYPLEAEALAAAFSLTPTVTPSPTRRPPTRTPLISPVATPDVSAEIHITIDNVTLDYGECTTIRWQTNNIDSIYFENEGVVGVSERQVCPQANTTYTIRVRLRDGRELQYPFTITVGQPPSATFPPVIPTIPPPSPTVGITPSPTVGQFCGNLICDLGETVCTCPSDCPGICIP